MSVLEVVGQATAIQDRARLSERGSAPRELITRERLAADLRALGVQSGQTLLVHASLRQIGWVEGGASTVVAALIDVLGSGGTLVAGAGTPENSVTSRTFREGIEGLTPAQVVGYRSRMPAFDRMTTPTSVGAVAEALRTTDGAERSDHPQSSFAAVGRDASKLMAGHRVTCHLGEDSPLGKLYERNASILLLGVGYQSCTAFHLAEYRYKERPPLQTYSCVVNTKGKRSWLTYQDVVLDDGEFEIIGKSLEDEETVAIGAVGKAQSRLLPLRCVVDFATEWLRAHRW
jgi:aminoglycoside 3-N-acetyltransferase